MAILERRPWLRQTREALEASKRETGDGSAPEGAPAGDAALVAKMLRWIGELAKALATIELRLASAEKIMAQSPSATVTGGSVTGDDTVTPVRNANAERQRRYRERKRQAGRASGGLPACWP
jgi:hypothetical protein